LRDFLLVWDWEKPLGESLDQEEYGTLTKTNSQALEYSKAEFGGPLDKATRLWNTVMILDDLKEYEKADQRLPEARSGYVTAFGKEHLPRLNGEYGRTPLSFVAGEGHADIVKLLLAEQINADSKDWDNGTPLSWAARNGQGDVVELLLEKGADPESKDTMYGRTPLSWAAENGQETMVEMLLRKGADRESKDTTHGRTPLSWAAENGHEAVVKLLLEKGAELDSKDRGHHTPLSWAARNGQGGVIELLLEKGAELESKDTYGWTPLSWAAENGHEAMVKMLLEKGAKLKPKDPSDLSRVIYLTLYLLFISFFILCIFITLTKKGLENIEKEGLGVTLTKRGLLKVVFI
jgi:ankyrin repeat protein